MKIKHCHFKWTNRLKLLPNPLLDPNFRFAFGCLFWYDCFDCHSYRFCCYCLSCFGRCCRCGCGCFYMMVFVSAHAFVLYYYVWTIFRLLSFSNRQMRLCRCLRWAASNFINLPSTGCLLSCKKKLIWRVQTTKNKHEVTHKHTHTHTHTHTRARARTDDRGLGWGGMRADGSRSFSMREHHFKLNGDIFVGLCDNHPLTHGRNIIQNIGPPSRPDRRQQQRTKRWRCCGWWCWAWRMWKCSKQSDNCQLTQFKTTRMCRS